MRGFRAALVAALLTSFFLTTSACQYKGGAPSTASPAPAEPDANDPEPSADGDESSALTVSDLAFSVPSPLILQEDEEQPLALAVQLQGLYTYPKVTGYFKPLDRSILWFSNDASVVSVSKQGVLSAKGVGQTFVMASLGAMTVPLQVMVREAPAPTLVSLAFDQGSTRLSSPTSRFLPLTAVLSDGTRVHAASIDTLELTLDCEPSFSSSDPAVAWVNQRGEVTPVANGTTDIAVYCGDVTASATVTVAGLSAQASTPQSPATGGTSGTAPGTPSSAGDSDENVEVLVISMSGSGPDSGWRVGASKALACELTFDTGSVSDVGVVFETPSGTLGEVNWESSDPDLARIDLDTGRVELLDYGTVVITASVTFGESRVEDAMEVEIKVASEVPTDGNAYLGPDDIPEVVEYGRNGGYGDQLRPEVFWFGPWETNTDVVSLGAGGSVTFPLHGYIPVDGEGIDFKVYENVIPGYPERAQVSVSNDGETFVAFPCDALDSDGDGAYQGCSGITPTADGGDGFDLADVGLAEIRYIRITDMDTCTPGDPTFILYEGSILCRGVDTQGADVDAIEIVNGVNE